MNFVKQTSSLDPVRSRAVALVDARYVRWLARMDDSDSGSVLKLSRAGLVEPLRHAIQRISSGTSLLRTYWYSDTDDHLTCDDQSLRMVPAHDSDGAGLVRQMTADLQSLVGSGRIDVVVIASDDDRLLSTIDSVKLAGVCVYLLADERAQAMPRLMQQDPNWARLLREADRRLILRSDELARALDSSDDQSTGGRIPLLPQEDLEAVVTRWWEEQSEDDREWLRDDLPALRGLPPEVDRELLLRAKNALNRSLNFHEKRWMREQARQIALGQLEESDRALTPSTAAG